MSDTLLKSEQKSLAALDPSFELIRPKLWRGGIIFASPHSGSVYPKSFIARSDLTKKELRRNEDIFVDDLFKPCASFGAPLLSARFPRCFVDVNRAPDEIPQIWTGENQKNSPRAEAGLGVVPTQLSETTGIYSEPFDPAFVPARIARLYMPYHNALQDLIVESVQKFGHALLIDCHSMPGFAPMGARRPDIVLGDRFGVSCHPDTMNRVEGLFRDQGYSVARNYPYAGGYVTGHYGKPDQGIEALQIEINRDLYLNPVSLAQKRGYKALARNIAHIIGSLVSQQESQILLAAQ